MQLIAFTNCPTSSYMGVVCDIECKLRFNVNVGFWKDVEGNGPDVVQGSRSDQQFMEGPKRNT